MSTLLFTAPISPFKVIVRADNLLSIAAESINEAKLPFVFFITSSGLSLLCLTTISPNLTSPVGLVVPLVW